MKYTHSFRHTVSLSLLCALFVGCKSETTTTADLAGAPELAAVQIPLTGSAQSEGIAVEDDAIDVESLTADELSQVEVKETTDAVRTRSRPRSNQATQPILARFPHARRGHAS
ncbi:MAG: hypothetical protein QM784_20905 [Polyangiaceae bacterium]